MLGSRLLPRPFGYVAVALGAASICRRLAALINAAAFSLAITLIIAQNLWVLAAAATLTAGKGSPASTPMPAQHMAQASRAV